MFNWTLIYHCWPQWLWLFLMDLNESPRTSCLRWRFWVSTEQATYLWGECAKGRGVKNGGGVAEATACLLSLGRTAFAPVSLLKNAEGKRLNACNHMLPWKQAHERDLCVLGSKTILVKDSLKECLCSFCFVSYPLFSLDPPSREFPPQYICRIISTQYNTVLSSRHAKHHLTDGQYDSTMGQLPLQQLDHNSRCEQLVPKESRVHQEWRIQVSALQHSVQHSLCGGTHYECNCHVHLFLHTESP